MRLACLIFAFACFLGLVFAYVELASGPTRSHAVEPFTDGTRFVALNIDSGELSVPYTGGLRDF